MHTFIETVINAVLEKHADFQNVVFVTSNKRSALLLRDAFIKTIKKQGFLPEFIEVNTLMEDISGLNCASDVDLLLDFYKVYLSVTEPDEAEPFETVLGWSKVLLEDYNDIDQYLIERDTIFPYLKALKDFKYWNLEADKTEIQKRYLAFWERIGSYYSVYTTYLEAKGLGYKGLVYRRAAENVDGYVRAHLDKTHIFVGFNILSTSEEHVFTTFLDSGKADVFWDVDAYFLGHEDHDAGRYINRYKREWKHYKSNSLKYVSNHFSEAKQITITACQNEISQAGVVGDLLEHAPVNHMVLVLANQGMLIPMLEAIPQRLQDFNITMGMSLQSTAFEALCAMMFQLYKETRPCWSYNTVVPVFTDPLVRKVLPQAESIVTRLQEANQIEVSPQALKEYWGAAQGQLSYTTFFRPQEERTPIHFISEVGKLIARIKSIPNIAIKSRDIEGLNRFEKLFKTLERLQNAHPFLSITGLHHIYTMLMHQQGIPFEKSNPEALQVMGLLETRNLDFETIIFCSVNEGYLPPNKKTSSYIPFEIRVSLGLPTYREYDAMYTYHFYRLLQRAKNIHILYNSDIKDSKSGEKSRFIAQLEFEALPLHSIKYRFAHTPLNNRRIDLSIKKTDLLMCSLQDYAKKGFSPSALATYISRPIDFYTRYVLGISEATTLEESIAANTLGTVMHNALESLYKPFEGKYLSISDIEAIQHRYVDVLTETFKQEYKGAIKGKNLISLEVAKACILRFIESEKRSIQQGSAIKLIALERKLEVPLAAISGLEFAVTLRGKIDRIDLKDNELRIIDYKTGNVEGENVSLKHWDDLIRDSKYNKAFQLLMYALMLKKATPFMPSYDTVTAGIVPLKKPEQYVKFTEVFDKNVKFDKKVKKEFIDSETLDHFEKQLIILIQEIFDRDIPFSEIRG